MDNIETYEQIKDMVNEAVEDGNAIAIKRHALAEVVRSDMAPGTFAITFFGTTKTGEEKHFVALVTTDLLEDFMQMALKGIIHARAVELWEKYERQ